MEIPLEKKQALASIFGVDFNVKNMSAFEPHLAEILAAPDMDAVRAICRRNFSAAPLEEDEVVSEAVFEKQMAFLEQLRAATTVEEARRIACDSCGLRNITTLACLRAIQLASALETA